MMAKRNVSVLCLHVNAIQKSEIPINQIHVQTKYVDSIFQAFQTLPILSDRAAFKSLSQRPACLHVSE